MTNHKEQKGESRKTLTYFQDKLCKKLAGMTFYELAHQTSNVGEAVINRIKSDALELYNNQK